MEAEEVESYNIELREEGDIKVVACSKNEGNCEGGKVCVGREELWSHCR